ncbi:MAG: glycine dehydrogenase, partial [Bacteroidota bacterium]
MCKICRKAFIYYILRPKKAILEQNSSKNKNLFFNLAKHITLLNLQYADQFVNRHIGTNTPELPAMLKTIGVENIDVLMAQTVPNGIRNAEGLNLPDALTEYEYLQLAQKIADKNRVMRNYIGLGYSDTITPPVIQRNLFENPGWYTQYTPYQAEIAQGRLESLLNFQTMVSDLTALPVANASLLDEGTAAAEAMAVFFHHKNKGKGVANRFLVHPDIFPQTLDVLRTRAEPLGISVEICPELLINNNGDCYSEAKITDDVFAVFVQYPTASGEVNDYRDLADNVHQYGAYLIVAADILSLSLLTPPGEWGADCAVGNTQRLGVPMGFGGPHAAYFAIKEEFKRVIPGRIIGVSIDAHGNRALRMALQTREQHIRREKATSNICTAQALLANMAAMYAVYHGPEGLRNIAERINHLTVLLTNALDCSNGWVSQNKAIFDTITFKNEDLEFSDFPLQIVRSTALEKGINFRYNDAENTISISLDETTTLADLLDILACFGVEYTMEKLLSIQNMDMAMLQHDNCIRTSTYLTHPVFNTHRSESQLMRYLKYLENKDLSLVHSMISLGSCTMKLNAAAEMMPVSMAGFSKMHPFQPIEQTQGYQQIFDELAAYLCEITGFTACSLQPNSGAQGEYAGLLAIRNYHIARGDAHRNIVLIPSSAHGTNPASAVMVGMQVVVTKCDERGNIDVTDLVEKAILHKEKLAALMVTYPSTHGVFETAIQAICQTIHENGGLVYMDGANMNAQVGLTSPGRIGADVCHLNLHKTFAIPHGGGGPGMGPICVNDKLKPFLSGHFCENNPHFSSLNAPNKNAVSAAPFGSASILLISYGYIRMLGAKGVADATKFAILNANYIKARLENQYAVLYTGENGRAAHELILDLRTFKPLGIEAEDIAKRLMDYGFHAPTLSFPVAGTIMIEPTESEDKAELDRFCDAM